jgi:putative spermidine/putrescine transport system permease protein
MCWMIVGLILPISIIIYISFWTQQGYAMRPILTLTNYAKFFTRPAYYQVLFDTLLQTLKLMVITFFLGYAIAYYIGMKVRSPANRIKIFLLLMIPFWTSTLIRTIAWIPFLGVTGVINQILLFFGIVDQPVRLFLFSTTGITMAQVSFYTLLMVGPILFTLHNIDRQLIEAAKCLKAPPRKVFFHIIFPLTLPGVVIGQILVFLNVMADFATATTIGGGKFAYLGNLVLIVYDSLQLPFASVMGVILMLCTLCGVAILLKAFDIRKL